MTDRELMQQALDALEHLQTDIEWQYKSPTRTMLRKVEKALRARLAQPEPEPVAWMRSDKGHLDFHKHTDYVPLYATTPQREWQGLTKEEARELCVANVPYVVDMVAALEARLKEKNT